MGPKLYTPYPYVKLVTARLVKAEFGADRMVGSLTAQTSNGAGIALVGRYARITHAIRRGSNAVNNEFTRHAGSRGLNDRPFHERSAGHDTYGTSRHR